jgi:hypothetical protein
MSVFALDVFEEARWPIALLMHLIPSIILSILTFISWKNRRLGGFLFLIAAIVMALFFHSPTIAIPVFIIAILFFF